MVIRSCGKHDHWVAGDPAGYSLQPKHRAADTLVAITSVSSCAASDPATAALRRAYAASAACAETYLLKQTARVGRMTAAERLKDLRAELLARLRLSGCAETNSCALPLAREILADAPDLTPVHRNRFLQSARRENRLRLSHGVLELLNPNRSERQVGRMRLP